MGLREELKSSRDEILKEWFALVAGDYPEETAIFLRNRSNRFANPVGHTIRETLDAVFAHLTGEPGAVDVGKALDAVVRIRAVQDFTPAEALGFLFKLKDVLRAKAPEGSEAELIGLFSEIDSLALEAFGIFMGCREKLYDLKVSELNNNTYRLLQDAQKARDESGVRQ